MNTAYKYLPLENGSLVFWIPDTEDFDLQFQGRPGLTLLTQFTGPDPDKTGYEFSFPPGLEAEIPGVQFFLPDPTSEHFASQLKYSAREILSALNGNDLCILYSAEREDELQDLLALFVLSINPNFSLEDLPHSEAPFGRNLEEWRKIFLDPEFPHAKIGSDQRKTVEFQNLRAVSSVASETSAKPSLPESAIQPSSAPKETAKQNFPSLDDEASPLLAESEPQLSPDTSPKLEPELNPEPKRDPEARFVEEAPELTKGFPESVPSAPETKKQPTDTLKFPLQLKMMGIISVVLACTSSAIIALATYYFKDDSEKRVQLNNMAITELIGLKVESDIQTIVAKSEQLILSSIRPNASPSEKAFVREQFFANDKDFIYVGLYGKKDDSLVLSMEFWNEDNLIESNITEEDIRASIQRNQEYILRAFLGKPVIVNSTPGFPVPSFILALPANVYANDRSKILIIQVKLEKILSAFEKKDITTTFMIGEEGRVIAHPLEEVVVSASNFSDLPIVQTLLTSQVNVGQIRYIAKDGSPHLGSYRRVGFGDAGIISIVSENKAFEEVYNLQERNLYIMGISLCLALIIIFLFAKSITKPILNLLNATLEIAKGNFRVNIKPTTRDEIGLLTRYFIQMGEGLEEREKVKSILGSMIDPVVVKEAMIDLAALKRGKEEVITAFFSDVAGFSTISEQLTSVELASLLNEYLSAMTIILKENEGVLDKYIGDAIVGIFGAPVKVENHERKACKASLEMILKLEELRQYWQKNNLYSKEAQTMDARIGLNTGPAKVGFMGTDALASYTMMGDTVNLAARLEAAGKDYGVNIMIAENTYRKVAGEFEIRILDLIRVKGKNEPVRVYELVGFKNSIPESLRESIGLYEEGFNEYLKQNWDTAIRNFEKSIQLKSGTDKAAKMLIERCKSYKVSPPGKNWDGVFTRTTK